MGLCINEKDEERESEAQSDVRAKKRARGGGMGGEKGGWVGEAISLATLRFVMVQVLFYFHLASWPRLFYLLLAPTCFRFSGLNLSFLFVTLPGPFF